MGELLVTILLLLSLCFLWWYTSKPRKPDRDVKWLKEKIPTDDRHLL